MSRSLKYPSVSYSEYLSKHAKQVEHSRKKHTGSDLPGRIWRRDNTVWKPYTDEISNRLGWLDSPVSMKGRIDEITEFSKQVVEEGYRHIVVLGMGGSSLSSEVFSGLFGDDPGCPRLHVLDTTHPAYIKQKKSEIELDKTLFIVSTKSGTTLETTSLMRYFYRQVVNRFGEATAASNFIVITDPGTVLEKTARDLSFRKVFLNDPDIGGRFSVLSYFGLVPASLSGVDLEKLLSGAYCVSEMTKSPELTGDDVNISASLGVAIGVLANSNVNKMYIVTSERLYGFNDWLEQLVAESTGKEGKSVLPVFERNFDPGYSFGGDAFFVFMGFEHDPDIHESYQAAKTRDYPSFLITIRDRNDIGEMFYLWEFAVAAAGAEMGINPFDQPNVEGAKIQTKSIVETYKESGSLDNRDYDFEYSGTVFHDSYQFNNIENFQTWLTQNIQENGKGYISLQVFLDPSGETKNLLQMLKERIEREYNIPVTPGFGPRYLHSTGQLHKGDSGEGIFIQITSGIKDDIAIPESMEDDGSFITFGTLILAQALGDYLALRERNRDTVRVHLTHGDTEALTEII